MIINGECIEEMKKLADKSIDLFLCDLPYGETDCKWDTIIEMEEFWKEFKRLRKSKKTACIHFCSTRFGYSLIKSWEKGFKMDMVWKKKNKIGGLNSRFRPMRNHEMVYFFYEQSPKYNRDKYHKRINNKPQGKSQVYGESLKVTSNGFGDSFGINNFDPINPASVFETKAAIGKRLHPTQKPLEILEFILKYWTDGGDTVLDPTMGCGSTGVACKKLGRNFIGIEKDEKIFETAKKYIDSVDEGEEIIPTFPVEGEK